MWSGIIFVFTHPLNKGKLFQTFLRVVWWKFNQLWIQQTTIVPFVDGIVCICKPNSSYGSLIVYTTWPEYEEMQFVQKTLQPNAIFVDIGAGIGDYSLLAASKIKTGKIIAFEPNKQVFKDMQDNIALNNLHSIISALPYAVSNISGEVAFDASEVSELGHISVTKKPSKRVERVKALKLDSFLKKLNIVTVDFLKVDVEGAESFVFEGAHSLLKRKAIKTILFELNPNSMRYNRQREQTLTLLAGYGYTFYFLNAKKIRPASIAEILKNKLTQNIIAKPNP